MLNEMENMPQNDSNGNKDSESLDLKSPKRGDGL